MIYQLLVAAVLLATPIMAGQIGDYITLQTACDPAVQNNGVVTAENSGKVCFPGAKCNPKTRICDCSDSDDGMWKRTFEADQCKLLPGSKCVNADQDYYRCVNNSKCTQIRKGVDDPASCPADAFCDTGDYACVCQQGKTCLEEKIQAPVP